MRKIVQFIIVLVVLCVNSACTQVSTSLPERTFEEFWKIFDNLYPSFHEKGIKWQGTYDLYRNQVNAKTTDEQLFAILSQMISPLNDSHVVLKARSINKEYDAEPDSEILKELKQGQDLRKNIIAMTQMTLLENGFDSLRESGPRFKGNKLFAYSDDGRIGYFRFFRSFSTMFDLSTGLGMQWSMKRALDEIFNSTHDIDALIVDVRFNMGGQDEFAANMISRFIDKPYLSHYRQTKLNKDKWTVLESVIVQPSKHSRYLKPVYLITNDRTLSAGDVFVLGMSGLPNVTTVGDRTNGSFSDLITKRLPNRWVIQLSHQRYYSKDMINYEGIGVPVNHEAKNSYEDLSRQSDSVLLEVLNLIRSDY